MKRFYCFLLMMVLIEIPGNAQNIHFLIPGGAGGGWDQTARGVGKALQTAELIQSASYENMSGGGGGKAIAYLVKIRHSNKARKTLMVNSTSIITRSLSGVFSQSFRALVPVAGVIADYSVFAVKKDSRYATWEAVLKAFRESPRNVKIAGGSAIGSTDHLVAGFAFKEAGGQARQVKYIPYDAGGKALAGLLTGEADVLSTGFSEVIELVKAGEMKMLAVTAPQRLPQAPEVPTLKEMGYNVVFSNWRGFFAAPDTPAARVKEYNALFQKMYQSDAWKKLCAQNGWVEAYVPGKERFYQFLEDQEKSIRTLMKELGLIQ